MRNALAHAAVGGRVSSRRSIATAFAQDDAEQAKAQWRRVADQADRRSRSPTLMDHAEPDVLAYMSFPKPSTAPSCTAPIRWSD